MEPTTNPQPTANPGAGATGAQPVDANVVGAGPSVSAEGLAPTMGANPEANSGVGASPGANSGVGASSGVDMSGAAPTVGVAPGAGVAPAAGGSVVGVPDTTGLITPAPETSAGLDGLPLTEPIMRPDLPPAPDPVKQELEAPLKAAGPAPGSIGSAVSVNDSGQAVDEKGQPIVENDKFGPKAGGSTPNVSFNDPAAQADQNGQPGAPTTKAKKQLSFNFDLKNMNRGVLVVLVVIAAMVVIGLAAVLIMQLMGS